MKEPGKDPVFLGKYFNFIFNFLENPRYVMYDHQVFEFFILLSWLYIKTNIWFFGMIMVINPD